MLQARIAPLPLRMVLLATLLLAADSGTADSGSGATSPVDVGGYGSFRYEVNDSDELANSMTLRRFIVTTDAHPSSRVQVYSELEYERLSEIEVERGVAVDAGGLEFEQELEGTNGSEIAVEQAWGQFELWPSLKVRFGAVLPPVGRLNLYHDDNLWNFPRRPLINRDASVLPAPAAWTEMGLGVTGEKVLGDGFLLAYEGYLLNGVGLDFAIEEKVQTRVGRRNKLVLEAVISPTAGAFDGSNTADAFAGRLLLSPAIGSEVALSGYYGRYTPSYLDVDERLWTLGIDTGQRVGPVSLQAEFLYSHFGGMRRTVASFARAAIDGATETSSDETSLLESEVEIALQGMSKDRYGLWVDAAVPIPLRQGWFGLESAVVAPVARYEAVWFSDDLQGLDFAGGQVTSAQFVDRAQQRISLGLTLRPMPLAVVHLVFERDDALKGGLIAPAVSQDAVNGITLGMAFGF